MSLIIFRPPNSHNPLKDVDPMEQREVNVIYVPQEIQDAIARGLTDGYEFNADLLKLGECLGKGAFGNVYCAEAHGVGSNPGWTSVAVKTLSDNASEKGVDDFIEEIHLMKKIGDHENVIKMLGCCTLSSPICLIMEYAPYGNLLCYLRTLRNQLEGNMMAKDIFDEQHHKGKALDQVIDEKDSERKATEAGEPVQDLHYINQIIESSELESFALQIAKGMTYVAGRGIVHRDLAARNILIGCDRILKISDFGLSREGVYVKSTSGKIPLRWLSVEAIRERFYSSASDVWAFGIVLWEICTLGGFPYPTVSDRDLLKFLVDGNRLEKPSNCTDEIYAIMLDCWSAMPGDRPTFGVLRDLLWKLNNNENPYVNIDPLESHQFPPIDEDSLASASLESSSSDAVKSPDPLLHSKSDTRFPALKTQEGTNNPAFRTFSQSDSSVDSDSQEKQDNVFKEDRHSNVESSSC